jgi:signal recognition particle receptor subunit beta
MALFNYATKEITLKIVYYGPGLSGKTTNLQHLHGVLNPETKGKLLSLSTESDRTLFFDFLPVELGKVRDFSIRFQLYTVPGQVRYNATRKVVLKGADAVVFVADSQKEMKEQNCESYENMRENLISNNINPDMIPILLQYNKRDLKNLLSEEDLNQDLNPEGLHETLDAVAINGTGVEETFRKITRLLLKDISRKHKIEIQPADEKKSPEAGPKAEQGKPVIRPGSAATTLSIRGSAPLTGGTVSDPAAFEPVYEPKLVPEYEVDAVEDNGEAVELMTEEESSVGTVEPEAVTAAGNAGSGLTSFFEAPAFSPVIGTVDSRQFESIPDGELQTLPVEKINAISENILMLSDRIGKMTDMVSLLQRTVADLRIEVMTVKNDISLANQGKSAKVPEIRDLKEFKDLRREQKDMASNMKEILDLLNTVKEKKSWFRI